MIIVLKYIFFHKKYTFYKLNIYIYILKKRFIIVTILRKKRRILNHPLMVY